MFVPRPTRSSLPRRARLVRKLQYWGERGDRVAQAPAVRRMISPTASLPSVRMVRTICAPLPFTTTTPPIRHHRSQSLYPNSCCPSRFGRPPAPRLRA